MRCLRSYTNRSNDQQIIQLRDNESNPDFRYKETIAILRVATGDLGFGPKCWWNPRIREKSPQVLREGYFPTFFTAYSRSFSWLHNRSDTFTSMLDNRSKVPADLSSFGIYFDARSLKRTAEVKYFRLRLQPYRSFTGRFWGWLWRELPPNLLCA